MPFDHGSSLGFGRDRPVVEGISRINHSRSLGFGHVIATVLISGTDSQQSIAPTLLDLIDFSLSNCSIEHLNHRLGLNLPTNKG